MFTFVGSLLGTLLFKMSELAEYPWNYKLFYLSLCAFIFIISLDHQKFDLTVIDSIVTKSWKASTVNQSDLLRTLDNKWLNRHRPRSLQSYFNFLSSGHKIREIPGNRHINGFVISMLLKLFCKWKLSVVLQLPNWAPVKRACDGNSNRTDPHHFVHVTSVKALDLYQLLFFPL